MMNLVDVPVIVSTLVTFFATGGADASIEFIKGITVNGSTKLVELKDELIVKPAVNKALEAYKADLSNTAAKQEFEQTTNNLEKYRAENAVLKKQNAEYHALRILLSSKFQISSCPECRMPPVRILVDGNESVLFRDVISAVL